jgi:hypothetical protein
MYVVYADEAMRSPYGCCGAGLDDGEADGDGAAVD